MVALVRAARRRAPPRRSGGRDRGRGRPSPTAVRTRSGWRGEADAVATNGDVVASYGLIEGDRARPETGQGAQAQALLAVAVRAPLRARRDLPRHPPPHASCSARATRNCSATSTTAARWRPTPRSTSTTRPRPTRRWRRRAARPSTRSPRSPTSARRRSTGTMEGERYAEIILDTLDERLIPDIRSRIRTRFHYAPERLPVATCSRTSARRSASSRCCGRSAWFRTHNRDDVIRNLYFVGAGTHPGAGIPGVVGSGRGDRRADARMSEAARTAGRGSRSGPSPRARKASASPARSSTSRPASAAGCSTPGAAPATTSPTARRSAMTRAAPTIPQARIAFLRDQTDAALAGKRDRPRRRSTRSARSPPRPRIPADLPARPPRRLRARRRRLDARRPRRNCCPIATRSRARSA